VSTGGAWKINQKELEYMITPEKILEDYKLRVQLMYAQKVPSKEVQDLSTQDVMYIRAILHPTKRVESKAMTRELLKFIYENKIVTAEQIYDTYGWSDNPVMKRLKLLKGFGLVKRVSKKYYLATPRLGILMTEYLDELCK